MLDTPLVSSSTVYPDFSGQSTQKVGRKKRKRLSHTRAQAFTPNRRGKLFFAWYLSNFEPVAEILKCGTKLKNDCYFFAIINMGLIMSVSSARRLKYSKRLPASNSVSFLQITFSAFCSMFIPRTIISFFENVSS